MAAPSTSVDANRGPAWPETAIGLGLLALAAVALWQTLSIPVSPLYAKVGPRVFPYLAVAGLALCAGFLIAGGLRGGWQPEEEREIALDKRALAFVAAGLIANVLLIGPLGFTASSTVLFTLVCHGFGSRRPARDALLGFSVALVAYLGFARLLGVNIGAGLIEGWVGG